MEIRRPLLSGASVLEATAHCVVREQETQVLIYNSRTDELHLIPRTGFFVYRLCDGSRTVSEVETEFRSRLEGPGIEVQPRLRAFLEGLVERGILRTEGAGQNGLSA